MTSSAGQTDVAASARRKKVRMKIEMSISAGREDLRWEGVAGAHFEGTDVARARGFRQDDRDILCGAPLSCFVRQSRHQLAHAVVRQRCLLRVGNDAK